MTITINGDATKSRGFTWYTTAENIEEYNDLQIVEANDDGLYFSKDQRIHEIKGMTSYEERSFWHKAVEEDLSQEYLGLFDYIAPANKADNTCQYYAKIEVNEDSLKIEMREIE